MTLADRIERGRRLCEKLQAEVAAIHPTDVTRSTWESVAPLDVDFLIALTAWEATGAESERLVVRDAYLAITNAWKAIAQQSARDLA